MKKHFYIVMVVFAWSLHACCPDEPDTVYVDQLRKQSVCWEAAKGAAIGAMLGDGSCIMLPDSVKSKLPRSAVRKLVIVSGLVGGMYNGYQAYEHNKSVDLHLSKNTQPIVFDQNLSVEQQALNKLMGK